MEGKYSGYRKIYKGIDEVRDVSGKYALPQGRLYLAYLNGHIAGCAAMRQIDAEYCEMKRLYVRPEFRGNQIGRILIQRIIEDAKEIGYKHIRLDTFPFMESAMRMYHQYAFYEIERYNDNPASTAVYMQKDL
ncbi:MAG: GNAT family N-acetyltransferase [Candidatus Limiplasma sp.]|nr:GNAT family N-acetyltransferase [Candidatus Limiplasma sp.]